MNSKMMLGKGDFPLTRHIWVRAVLSREHIKTGEADVLLDNGDQIISVCVSTDDIMPFYHSTHCNLSMIRPTEYPSVFCTCDGLRISGGL